MAKVDDLFLDCSSFGEHDDIVGSRSAAYIVHRILILRLRRQ
jgi:hypothetical protein